MGILPGHSTVIFTFYAGVAWSRSEFTAFTLNKPSSFSYQIRMYFPRKMILLTQLGKAIILFLGGSSRQPDRRPIGLSHLDLYGMLGKCISLCVCCFGHHWRTSSQGYS